MQQQQNTSFADIILPLALPGLLTYAVPHELEGKLMQGMRVVVQLGKNKLYTGLVYKIHRDAPSGYQAKPILSPVDEFPVVNGFQLEFWQWMASYYMCTLGEVMAAALPAGLKLSSESRIMRRTMDEIDYSVLGEREHLIMEALEMQAWITIDDISKMLGIKTVQPYIRSLIDRELIIVEQEIRDVYRPKTEVYLELSEEADHEETLKKIFDELVRAPKQLQALMQFVYLSSRYTEKIRAVKKSAMLEGERASDAAIRELVKKNILVEKKREIGRFDADAGDAEQISALSEEQQQALESIRSQHAGKDVVLLHGVTSSGKTEVYIKLIEETVAAGKQVLFLIPEIALTAQLIFRVQKYFPGKVGVYHSKFNENERVEIWKNILAFDPSEANKFQIVLGARSSVFLPYTNLGLIIVDEEHETSYKQQDPDPRYNARDAAIFLASLHGAKVLLGSATPSVESYYNATHQKYGLTEMHRRFGNVMLPEVLTADVKYDQKHRRMQGHYTAMLMEQIGNALQRREQVILFQNRRGYSLIVQCDTCGWSPQCKNCDITLTYHKNSGQLRCHYCGYFIPMVQQCAACKSTTLSTKGFGTEKVEDELSGLFPGAKIARLDLDAARSKNAYAGILREFADGAVDILVGTQMVTKGLDFDNVSLVGILNADNMLHFPDFRAHERAYQLMAQVSGRAGRRQKRGTVVIQTYNPYHFIIQKVITNDYAAMYAQELIERRNFHYPPFFRMIHISLRNADFNELKAVANRFGDLLKSALGKRVLGPEIPAVARIRNKFIFNFMIRIERGASLPAIKSDIRLHVAEMRKDAAGKRTQFMIDVDPY